MQPALLICRRSAMVPSLVPRLSATRQLHSGSIRSFFAQTAQHAAPIRNQVRAYATASGTNSAKANFPSWQIGVSIMIGVALGSLDLHKLRPSYRSPEELNIPKTVDNNGMRSLIKEMVRNEDKAAIEELIRLLHDMTNFPNVDDGHLWEIDISNALLETRNLILIREIFPQFRLQTLSYSEKYYIPIENDNLELLQAMHEGGMVHPKDGHDERLEDALLFSIVLKREKIIKYLLKEAGYDINKSYRYTDRQRVEKKTLWNPYQPFITPAYLAVVLNDPAMLQLLISLGADCNTPNTRPYNRHGSEGYAQTPLLYALANGYDKCARLILEIEHIDLNYQGGDLNRPALTIATAEGCSDIARMLISKGADVNIVDGFQFTAIMFSTMHGDLSTLEALLKAGANPRCVDDHGHNLWNFAATSPKPSEVCALLKKAGIQDLINDEDKFGKNALFSAVDRRKPEGVKALIENGASLTKTTRNLGWYTCQELNFKNGEEVTVQAFANAILVNLKKDLGKAEAADRDSILAKIQLMDEIIAILSAAEGTVNK